MKKFACMLVLILALMVLTFAVKVHDDGRYHPTWGDRADGRLIRSTPAIDRISPYIMVTRNTSTNFFEDSFDFIL